MPRLVTPARIYERILLYGPPKCGKTRLAAAIARALGLGKIGYVTADPPADMLSSICPEDKPAVIPLEPRPEPDADGKVKYDPLKEAVACATWSWEPEVGVIIWDTLTTTGKELLAAVARTEQAPADSSDGRITFGKKGDPSYVVTPSRSDYGSGQGLIQHLLRHLFNQPRHLIVVCHQTMKEPKTGPAFGGPDTIGSSMVEQLCGWFTSTLHMETRTRKVVEGAEKKVRTDYIVRTQSHGIWVAGVRTPGDPMPDGIVLEKDPAHFWMAYRDARGLEVS